MKYIFFVLIVLLVGCNAGEDKRLTPPQSVAQEQQQEDGETLFKNNCANCHKPDKDYTGPALQGSLQRWQNDKKAMYDFIRNPQKSIEQNSYAKQIFKKWNGTLMTPFPNLSDEEIDKIMAYCDNITL
jgi:cytochrome c551/c552